jgi:hypothetical protein
VSKPTTIRPEDPEYVDALDLKTEAIRETSKELKAEAHLDEAESLKLDALDRIKDPEREDQIEKLESAGDLFEEARPLAPDRDDRREKIKPAKVEKAWFTKTEAAQRRVLQKKLGSYRPEPDDPISQRPPAKAVAEGSLFDKHPLSRVRIRGVEATGTIKAAIPAPLPVKPVNPGLAEEPIPGRCLECYKPLRKRDRAGTKFCTDNMGDCRKAYNAREANRAERNELWKAWDDSQHDKRMLSIHCAAADAMWRSAVRCGIDVTFTADDDGVMTVHTKPLPPIVPLYGSIMPCFVTADGIQRGPVQPQIFVWLEVDDGSVHHDVEIVATETDTGTLYSFEMARPEGFARDFGIGFEGDPGPEWTSEAFLTQLPPLPPGAAMYAARNGRSAEFLAARKRDLAA